MQKCSRLIGTTFGLILVGCSADPIIVKEPIRVEVPVPIPCSTSGIKEVPGPDLAPSDSDALSAAAYVRAQLIRLRAEVEARRQWELICSKGE